MTSLPVKTVELDLSQAQTAFETLRRQVDAILDDLKMQSAEACLEGNFVRVKKISEKHNELISYRKKLEKFQSRWRDFIECCSRPATDAKEAAGKLRVIFEDEIIEQATSQETFVAALSKIGLAQIAVLNKQVDGRPLITFVADENSGNPLSGGQWKINSDMDDVSKRKALKDISKKLHIPLTVDLA